MGMDEDFDPVTRVRVDLDRNAVSWNACACCQESFELGDNLTHKVIAEARSALVATLKDLDTLSLMLPSAIPPKELTSAVLAVRGSPHPFRTPSDASGFCADCGTCEEDNPNHDGLEPI